MDEALKPTGFIFTAELEDEFDLEKIERFLCNKWS